MTNTTNKYTSYPIIESLAKGIIIDGFTTATILAIPFIAPGYLEIPALSKQAIITISTVYGSFGAVSFLIKADARENGHSSLGGVQGGALKYAGREITLNYFDKKSNNPDFYLYKGIIGGINSYFYEQCNDYNEICSDNIIASSIFSVAIEGLESFIPSFINNENYLKVGLAGSLSGLIAATFANYVYTPLVPTFYNAYDYLENSLYGATNSLTAEL